MTFACAWLLMILLWSASAEVTSASVQRHGDSRVTITLLARDDPSYIYVDDVGARVLSSASSALEAWVTFLDASVEGFVLGAVVLGHSIRHHAVDRSRGMVCLVAGSALPSSARVQLEAAGWTLEEVEFLANPMATHPAKLSRVWSKLAVLGLPYRRVVYLDADTLVVNRRAENLFSCPATVCGVLRHSERWNTGVITVAPSQELLTSAKERMSTTQSYTGGDQGLLNEIFDLAKAPLLDDDAFNASAALLTSARLSSSFNADIGLFLLSRRFAFSGEPAIVHFTLGCAPTCVRRMRACDAADAFCLHLQPIEALAVLGPSAAAREVH